MLKRVNKLINGELLATRVYALALKEAVQIIESLQEKNNPHASQTTQSVETPLMPKILQEVLSIKTSISDSNLPTRI